MLCLVEGIEFSVVKKCCLSVDEELNLFASCITKAAPPAVGSSRDIVNSIDKLSPHKVWCDISHTKSTLTSQHFNFGSHLLAYYYAPSARHTVSWLSMMALATDQAAFAPQRRHLNFVTVPRILLCRNCTVLRCETKKKMRALP